MLPQFDLTFFPSQIFWLLVCFGLFLLFVQFYFFPKMQNILEKREIKIRKEAKIYEHNIHEIKKLEEYHQKIILEAKREAEAKIKQATEQAKHFMEQKQFEIDKTLNDKFEEAKQGLINEIKAFEGGIAEEVLKSAKQIINKIDEVEVSEETLKKFDGKH